MQVPVQRFECVTAARDAAVVGSQVIVLCSLSHLFQHRVQSIALGFGSLLGIFRKLQSSEIADQDKNGACCEQKPAAAKISRGLIGSF